MAKAEKYLLSIPPKENLWNEMGDLLPFLKDQLEAWKRNKIEGSRSRIQEVEHLVLSNCVIRIEFTPDIFFKVKRRQLGGRVVDAEKRPEADCCIIESLITYFDGRHEENQLLFCTENLQDFGITVNKKNALHPLLKEGLPPTEVFTNLTTLIGFLNEHKKVEEPAPEEVDKALEKEKAKKVQEQTDQELVLKASEAAGEFLRGQSSYVGSMSTFTGGPALVVPFHQSRDPNWERFMKAAALGYFTPPSPESGDSQESTKPPEVLDPPDYL